MTREEAIIEGRRKLNAGDFQRAVVKTIPEDVGYDRLTLECGHTIVWLPGLALDDKQKAIRERCSACAAAWILENTDAS